MVQQRSGKQLPMLLYMESSSVAFVNTKKVSEREGTDMWFHYIAWLQDNYL